MSTKEIRWEGVEACEIVDTLLDMGFEKDELESSKKRPVYAKLFNTIEGGVDFIRVTLDFDPYMHIDETDDEIYYGHPVYVYVDRSLLWYNEERDSVYVRNMEHLRDIIEELENTEAEISYDEDED